MTEQEKIYQNGITGEITDKHSQAMEWYRAGANIGIFCWNSLVDNWVARGSWIH